jgi:hypothetical protein
VSIMWVDGKQELPKILICDSAFKRPIARIHFSAFIYSGIENITVPLSIAKRFC